MAFVWMFYNRFLEKSTILPNTYFINFFQKLHFVLKSYSRIHSPLILLSFHLLLVFGRYHIFKKFLSVAFAEFILEYVDILKILFSKACLHYFRAT